MDTYIDGLHVTGSGEGKATILLLHFFGGSARSWNPLVGALAESHRCIAPDLRGFGASVAPESMPSVSDYADDVIMIIRSLKLDNFMLAGHSMGGKIALAVAARRPPGLAAVILMAPSPPTPEPFKEGEREKLLQAFADGEALIKMVTEAAAHPLPEELLETTVQDQLLSSKAAWEGWLEGGSREDISGQVAQLELPILVIAGGRDQKLSPRFLRSELMPLLPSARMETVPDAGHLLPLEAPEAVAAVIKKFIQVR